MFGQISYSGAQFLLLLRNRAWPSTDGVWTPLVLALNQPCKYASNFYVEYSGTYADFLWLHI